MRTRPLAFLLTFMLLASAGFAIPALAQDDNEADGDDDSRPGPDAQKDRGDDRHTAQEQKRESFHDAQDDRREGMHDARDGFRENRTAARAAFHECRFSHRIVADDNATDNGTGNRTAIVIDECQTERRLAHNASLAQFHDARKRVMDQFHDRLAGARQGYHDFVKEQRDDRAMDRCAENTACIERHIAHLEGKIERMESALAKVNATLAEGNATDQRAQMLERMQDHLEHKLERAEAALDKWQALLAAAPASDDDGEELEDEDLDDDSGDGNNTTA